MDEAMSDLNPELVIRPDYFDTEEAVAQLLKEGTLFLNTNGPARVWADGGKEWWVDGKKLTEDLNVGTYNIDHYKGIYL